MNYEREKEVEIQIWKEETNQSRYRQRLTLLINI